MLHPRYIQVARVPKVPNTNWLPWLPAPCVTREDPMPGIYMYDMHKIGRDKTGGIDSSSMYHISCHSKLASFVAAPL
eukprot:g5090.t1